MFTHPNRHGLIIRKAFLGLLICILPAFSFSAERPSAEYDFFEVTEDTPIVMDVLANDSGIEPLSVISITEPFKGKAVINPDNTITYTPNPNFAGQEFIGYVMKQSAAELDAVGFITINVLPVNDPPVLDPIPNITVSEGELISFGAEAYDPDADDNNNPNLPPDFLGAKLTYSFPQPAPAGAQLHPQTGVFSWTPTDAQTNKNYVIPIRVEDDGGFADTKVFNVRVNFLPPDNTAPRLTVLLGGPGVALKQFSAITPVSGPNNTVSYSVTETLTGVVSLMITAEDNNLMDYVVLEIDSETKFSSNSGGGLNWDTRTESNGAHLIEIYAQDRNNPFNSIRMEIAVNVHNDVSAGRVFPHPDEGFRAADTPAEIYATFEKEVDADLLYEQGIQNALRVRYAQNGVVTNVEGLVTFNQGVLRFHGQIPDNSEVEWVVNAPEKLTGATMAGIFRFFQPLRSQAGGTVKSSDGRLSIFFPPGSLKSNQMIRITSPHDSSASDGADVEIVAGPYQPLTFDANGANYTDLLKPATLTYVDPTSQQRSGYVQQIQACDASACRPLEAKQISSAGITLSLNINKLSTFRIVNVFVPNAGVSDLYNFPNPFGPKEGGTKFHYILSENSDVTISIFDLMGNPVRRMVITAGDSGGHIGENFVLWDGRNGEGHEVSNGGYLVRISAKGASGTEYKAKHKVMVVK